MSKVRTHGHIFRCAGERDERLCIECPLPDCMSGISREYMTPEQLKEIEALAASSDGPFKLWDEKNRTRRREEKERGQRK